MGARVLINGTRYKLVFKRQGFLMGTMRVQCAREKAPNALVQTLFGCGANLVNDRRDVSTV
jgi:hypothetical protein